MIQDQQHQYYLRTCQKCKLSSPPLPPTPTSRPALTLLSQNLLGWSPEIWFLARFPEDSDTSWSLKLCTVFVDYGADTIHIYYEGVWKGNSKTRMVSYQECIITQMLQSSSGTVSHMQHFAIVETKTGLGLNGALCFSCTSIQVSCREEGEIWIFPPVDKTTYKAAIS